MSLQIPFSKLLHIQASPTVVINSMAAEKRAQGERVYNLSVGEARLPTPEIVIEAATRAMKEGKTRYTPAEGIPELCVAATTWMNRMYGASYLQSETMITCGGKFAIFAILQALLEPGDEVIVPAPYWTSYQGITALFGGKMVAAATEEITTPPAGGGSRPYVGRNWKLEISNLEKATTKKTKVFIFNNASNPTGVVYSKKEIEEILAWAKKKKLFVISDEVYSGLVYSGEDFVSAGSFREHRDHVAVVQSCSKHFAMTGWRVGMLFASASLIDVVSAIQTQSTTGTSTISQWAALAAIENAGEIIPRVRAAVRERRDAFVDEFQKQFGISIPAPSSGLYCFIPMKAFGVEETDSQEFCTAALREANVAMVPGVAFGVDGYVRCSFGEPEDELRAGVAALAEWVKKTYNR